MGGNGHFPPTCNSWVPCTLIPDRAVPAEEVRRPRNHIVIAWRCWRPAAAVRRPNRRSKRGVHHYAFALRFCSDAVTRSPSPCVPRGGAFGLHFICLIYSVGR
eukprot:COSAG02_NODE_468_length_21758_cov_41.206796_5_plen_103_part_00